MDDLWSKNLWAKKKMQAGAAFEMPAEDDKKKGACSKLIMILLFKY